MAKEKRWTVELSPAAQSDMDELRTEHGDDAYDDTLDELLALEEDPTPAYAVEMRGARDHYRIYLYRSLYRAIYRVFPKKELVWVLRVETRDVVYSGWDRW